MKALKRQLYLSEEEGVVLIIRPYFLFVVVFFLLPQKREKRIKPLVRMKNSDAVLIVLLNAI